MQYDPLNQVTRVTDARAGVTQFSRDPNGNLLSVTDARGSVTTYAYNPLDRVTTRTDPLLRAETYTYDNAGNRTGFTDRKGQLTQSVYDALNRIVQVRYADQSTITYTYDAGDRVTQITDSVGGAITRAYDLLDRLTQETTPQGTVTYAYDAAGRRTTMTVSGQVPVTYAYDNADRLTQVTQGSAIVALVYDAAGRRTSVTAPNGVVTAYTYDAASQLTGLTYSNGATVIGSLTYTYDSAGNRIKTGGTWARTGLPHALPSATYDAANQLTTWGGGTLSYDANGNLISDGGTTYSWDARNRLVSLANFSLTESVSYDGAKRRSTRTVNGISTTFLYDGANPVQETAAGNTAILLTGLGLDEYFTRTDAAGTRTLLRDALGSTVSLADGTATIQTSYTYEPFGASSASGAANGNPYQFTGRENDGTALYYYRARARYYHPQLQRFISEDPMGFASGDANVYVYVGDSPVNYVDPWGLDRKEQGCDLGYTFAMSFRQRVHVTNNFLFNPTATLVKGGLGLALGTGAVVARGIGTVAPAEAVIGAFSGGVANLTVGATLASGAFTFTVNGVLSAAALEGRVLVGSAASALGEAVSECALR